MPATFAGLLADVILLLHIAYVATVVFGLFAIWIGWFRGWRWVRNPWLRGGHLAMIAVVVAESWLGLICPLTTWEAEWRTAAGQPPDDAGPLAAWLHPLRVLPRSVVAVHDRLHAVRRTGAVVVRGHPANVAAKSSLAPRSCNLPRVSVSLEGKTVRIPGGAVHVCPVVRH